jgi:hypothetical protein
MGMTTSSIDTWFNAGSATLNLNFYSKGLVQIGSTGQGNLKVEGYTEMGDDFNAPRIKMNVLYGTTDNNASTSIAHGISSGDKILDVSVVIENGISPGATYYPDNDDTNISRKYRLYWDDTSIHLANMDVALWVERYKITITYRD